MATTQKQDAARLAQKPGADEPHADQHKDAAAKKKEPVTLAEKKQESRKLDRELEESFPTSDPPSFSAGSTGAPSDR